MVCKRKKLSIIAVDLFCGTGGLTYGLNKSGIKVIAGVNFDEKCKFAFEENNSALFIHKSIKEITSKEILKLYPAKSLKVLAHANRSPSMSKAKKNKKPWFRKPSSKVSERMKRVKSIGTRLEHRMEKLLDEKKIKYERQPELFGRPDFQIKGTNILVFCDSSFWHGRREKELKGESFKKNKEFWMNKLIENRKRDARINRALRKEDWRVLRFWDTDISKFPEKITKKLLREIKK